MNQSSAACHAVLPAAGIGSRMGSAVPKQYLPLAGATLFEHSLRTLLSCARLKTVVVALHPDDDTAAELPIMRDPRVRTVTGGAERCDSVLAGLEALAAEVPGSDWVLVHDAARPCLQATDLEQLIDACLAQHTGAILAEPVVDTVKRADDRGQIVATLDRTGLWRAQTPQMFPLQELSLALVAAAEKGLSVTDEASAMEMAGHPVRLVPGSPRNLKVTVPEDLLLAAWYLQRGAAGVDEESH